MANPGRGRVTFLLLRDVDTPEYKSANGKGYLWDRYVSGTVSWHAELRIQANDIAALMRQGLFWSEDNFDQTKGYYVLDALRKFDSPMGNTLGFAHCRYYELSDIPDSPQWKGSLCVYAHHPSTLREFRVDSLGLSNVRFVLARNWVERLIYQFDSTGVVPTYSTLTGETPLLGWGPWPRNEEEKVEVDDDESKTDEEKREDADTRIVRLLEKKTGGFALSLNFGCGCQPARNMYP